MTEADRTYTVKCNKCKGERRMTAHTHELGYRDVYISRWCACPPSEVVTVGPFPSGGDPEVETEPTE